MTDLNLDASISEAVPSESRYMTQHDVTPAGIDLTIKTFKAEAMPGDDTEIKTLAVWTDASYKPMVLNVTNRNRLIHHLNTDKMREMCGKTVNVYRDPDVEYAGKIVGGLRIRAAAVDPVSAAIANAQTTKDQAEPNDDIPF